jgi:hypothetical protein
MALQLLTARAILTAPLCQGFVGAGRVVSVAHDLGQPTTYLVPTSPTKPASHKDSPRRFWFERMNPNRLRAGRSAA